MQSDVEFGKDSISGTLHYVSGYTGFSSKSDEQNGNYLAFRVDTDDEDDTITVELVGGKLGHPVTLDEDRNIVLLIGNKTQTVKIVVTHDGESITKVYSLNKLVLEATPSPEPDSNIVDGNGNDSIFDGNGDEGSPIIDGNGN